ncbi:MAG: hypothetical protein HC799_08570 [Limnothrix sp. RL_2_0]|nr:hypothetical protein [Limnothrix sp. RL_2_0]
MKNLTETGIARGNIEFQNANIDLLGNGGGGFGVTSQNLTLSNSFDRDCGYRAIQRLASSRCW